MSSSTRWSRWGCAARPRARDAHRGGARGCTARDGGWPRALSRAHRKRGGGLPSAPAPGTALSPTPPLTLPLHRHTAINPPSPATAAAPAQASDEQLDFPVLYASGKQGWATEAPPGSDGWDAREAAGMAPLLDRVLLHCPPPVVDDGAPFAMVVTMMGHDPYVGRLLTGRVMQGQVRRSGRARAWPMYRRGWPLTRACGSRNALSPSRHALPRAPARPPPLPPGGPLFFSFLFLSFSVSCFPFFRRCGSTTG